MVARKMFFGNTVHAQWVPCPATGMRRTRQGWSEKLEFENGGAWIEESAAWHTVYEMEFPVADSSEYDGIEAFARFASREYGSDFLRFVDPMQMELNVFTPVWAAPGLIEEGWKNFGGSQPVFSDTDPSLVAVGYPTRHPTWEITAPDTEFQGKTFTLLLPPGYDLLIGGQWEGFLAAQYPDGTFVDLTADASPLGWAATFNQATVGGHYVRIGLRGVDELEADPFTTIVGLFAQYAPTGATPAPSRFRPGGGHAGLRFRGKALPETYVMKQNHLTGMSAELVEVEPWED